MNATTIVTSLAAGLLATGLIACQASQSAAPAAPSENSEKPAASPKPLKLSEAQLEELVLRSYPYVAMFNVNNGFALDPKNPLSTNGYNRVRANTTLADHTLRSIARPNNDTLYVVAMVDVTREPVVLKMPAFDSKYVSLMVTGYDHYVNIPMSTSQGDFKAPQNVLFYSERTPGYDGEPIEEVDRTLEVTSDYVSAILRVMPQAAEPKRFAGNVEAMRSVEVQPLSAFHEPNSAAVAAETQQTQLPAFGTDLEVYGDRFLEVMQFVVNHTTFDADNELDVTLLETLKPLGIVRGKVYDPDEAVRFDSSALEEAAKRFQARERAKMGDPEFVAKNLTRTFQSKGQMTAELLATQSVVGPIGQPATEALYPPIHSEDGKPLNAQFDYEVVMTADQLPPAKAFWSITLYDLDNGFFIPNERKKYSVGENAGYQLDDQGGIRIVIAAEKPKRVPEENWLPITRGDEDIDLIMRIYSPNLEQFRAWTPPVARRLD